MFDYESECNNGNHSLCLMGDEDEPWFTCSDCGESFGADEVPYELIP